VKTEGKIVTDSDSGKDRERKIVTDSEDKRKGR
jgi:hypothetical protein